jgi:predicted RNase H-like HicB family nuclease
MEYTAIIKEIEDGWYMGQCEQVPGAMTQGRTIDEVQENLKEAIALILEDEKEDFRKEHRGEKFLRRKIAVL